MIEQRAMLRRDRNFEGGFSLKSGTVIYAREIEEGVWLGMYYEDKGSGHGFALEFEDFSLMYAGQERIQEWVVMDDPPVPTEEIKRERELALRRMKATISRHREEADRLELLLEAQS